MGQKMELQFEQQPSHALSSPKPIKFKSEPKTTTTNNNKFVGVRQRASGRWVAEIKDTTQKLRVWLGTFKTAEEAARAYDEAACLLRGSNTRTNFFPSSVSEDSPLACRIRNLLLNKKQPPPPTKKAAAAPTSSAATSKKTIINNRSSGKEEEHVYPPESPAYDQLAPIQEDESRNKQRLFQESEYGMMTMTGVQPDAINDHSSDSFWDLPPLHHWFHS